MGRHLNNKHYLTYMCYWQIGGLFFSNVLELLACPHVCILEPSVSNSLFGCVKPRLVRDTSAAFRCNSTIYLYGKPGILFYYIKPTLMFLYINKHALALARLNLCDF